MTLEIIKILSQKEKVRGNAIIIIEKDISI